MGMYEDLIAQGWQPAQISMYYPDLLPGGEMPDLLAQARERSYVESTAAFERGYQLWVEHGRRQDTEYERQLYLQEHPEYFADLGRAQIEIGIPSDASFAAAYPQYATGTRYQEYGTTAPAFREAGVYKEPKPEPRPLPAYQPPEAGDWGDMLAAGVLGVLGMVGLGFLFGKK